MQLHAVLYYRPHEICEVFFFFFEDVKGLFKLTGCTWVQDANFLSTVLRINICLFFNFHIIGLALSLCS
jgi:hypothetical protein